MSKVYLIILLTTLTCCALKFDGNAVAIHEFQSPPPSSATITIPDADSLTPQQPEVQITSHTNGQTVPVGPLTIFGTSSDTSLSECQVYADLNDKMPFQRVLATGPSGPDDYSQWTFIYSGSYQLIQNGTNNLTSKIICVDSPAATKWHSVNLTGISGIPSTGDSTINQAITSGNPSPSPPSSSPPMGLPLPAPNQAISTSSPLDPVVGEEDEDEEGDDLVSLFETSNDEEDEEEIGNSDDEDDEDEEEDGGRERCPNGYHRSPSGDCERVRDLPDNLPRCPNGFHRSPDGYCERVRD